jgi:N-acetylneuraminic acid mutarotase
VVFAPRRRRRSRRFCVVTESLESRRLLAFALNVNFQPSTSAVPTGYVADSGLTYANRGNGFSYGWTSVPGVARERNANADQRYDTLIHTSAKTWEVAVPNGTYTLKLVAGDASYYDSVYAFSAEGVLALSGTPTSTSRFVTSTKSVNVGDGKLTITSAAGAVNNKLAFLEISQPLSPPPPPPPPPSTTLPSIPATIQAEDFDNGGKNVSYFDTTYGNSGKVYRSTDVDIVTSAEGGYAVGYTRPGEWLKYTFNAPVGGTFNLEMRVATGNAGGVFRVEIDGVDKTGPMNLLNTGGWQVWKTLAKSGVAIGAGQHVMRVVFDTSAGSDIGDISWVKFSSASTPTTPTLSIAATDNSAAESGTNTGKFTITRSGSTSASLLVNYAIGGSATNGTDYSTIGGSITIPAGAASAAITVTPKDDASVEGNETVVLTLSPKSGYALGTSSATVTIADNDVPTTTGQWPATFTAVTPLARVRQEGRGAIVNGKLWVFGGFYSNAINATGQVDIYDIATDTWSKLPEYGPMPHTHSSVAVDGNSIYFVGGLFGDFPGVPTDRVYKFDTVTRTWSEPLPKLPVAFHSGGAAIVNGNLHYFGGSEADRVTDTGRHLVLNLSNPSAGWQAAPSMPDPRCHFSTAVLNGKIYAIGGQHDHENHVGQSAAVHRYDPVTKTWEQLANLPTPKSHAEMSTFIRNGRIIVAGGQIGRFGSTDEVVSYDPSTNKWTQIGKLPTPLQSGYAMVWQNKVIVTTGNRGDGSPRGDTWVGEFV